MTSFDLSSTHLKLYVYHSLPQSGRIQSHIWWSHTSHSHASGLCFVSTSHVIFLHLVLQACWYMHGFLSSPYASLVEAKFPCSITTTVSPPKMNIIRWASSVFSLAEGKPHAGIFLLTRLQRCELHIWLSPWSKEKSHYRPSIASS